MKFVTDAVTVTVTRPHVTWKSIEGFERMMLYSMFRQTHGYLG